ncbi:PAS domain S-box protein [Salinimicrobium sp. GXAS 041]|uniref:PAS domain S-box protein n=1 Tax=Salinimicrobium sp. GXAS 041 TaxID=3400806 RepID=UPI003C72AC35
MEQINPKLIFEAIPFPCLLLQPITPESFKVIEVNNAYINTTGLSKEKLLKSTFFESQSITFYENACLINSLKKVLQSGEADNIPVFRQDFKTAKSGISTEKYWKAKNSPLFNEQGETTHILHVLLDVSHEKKQDHSRKDLQQKFLHKEKQYQHFIDENPDGLFSLDLEGNLLNANKRLAEFAEVSIDQLLQMNLLSFCAEHQREKVLQIFEKVKKGTRNKFEVNFISVKGSAKIIEISLAPILEHNIVTGMYGFARNFTERHSTESIVVAKKKFLEVNAAFMSSLIENEPEDPKLEETFSIIGATVDVDRMYYFGATKNKENKEIFISQILEWCSEFASPQKHNPEMQDMPVKQVEQIMGPLTTNTPFMSTLSELPKCELKDLFIEQDIKSMLLLPIFFQNNLYGFIGFDDCRQERKWHEEEIAFLQSLAHFFTNALEKRSAQNKVKQQEEELRRSEKKFKALVQEGADLIAILDKIGNFTFTSGTSTSALGVAPAEFIGENVFDFIHPDDKERVTKAFTLLKEQKQIKTEPFRFRNKNGDWRWIETAATNLLEDPAVEGIVINSRDITTLIEQAREIEQINERYRLAAAATRDLIYDWDLEKDEVIRFHNSNRKLLGHPTSEVDKRNFWRTHIHPDELKELENILKTNLSNPKKDSIQTQYRFKRTDGTYAHLIDRGHIIRNSEGKAIRLIGATSDISEMTQQKEALKAANTRFKLAMKATREMIWDWDIATDKVNRSKSFAKIYGYNGREESTMTKFWLPKITEKDRTRVQNSLKYVLENEDQKEWKQEYRFMKADGNPAYVMDRGYIIRDRNGKPIRMVGAVLDVTASRRLIRDIKKQNKGLKEIAWAQSHIVRAPLARLKGLVDLLEMADLEKEKQGEILGHIKDSANELDDILRGIVSKTEKIEINHEEA